VPKDCRANEGRTPEPERRGRSLTLSRPNSRSRDASCFTAFHRHVSRCTWQFVFSSAPALEDRPGLSPRRDLPGLLAWHIILVLAQPRRKRAPDSPMGEAPALGQIVEDHLGRVLVGDS